MDSPSPQYRSLSPPYHVPEAALNSNCIRTLLTNCYARTVHARNDVHTDHPWQEVPWPKVAADIPGRLRERFPRRNGTLREDEIGHC